MVLLQQPAPQPKLQVAKSTGSFLQLWGQVYCPRFERPLFVSQYLYLFIPIFYSELSDDISS